MDLITLTLYVGYFLLIIGTVGAVIGPLTKDPFKRFLNIEVPAIGVCLIFLAYNQTLALMTFLGVNAILTLVLVRTIIKNEEMEE
ncbi:MAG: energy-converting hydrogenase subunit [Methanococcus sp.]|nr:energy-converting hydrogenase subunit [Methanococcus sp.]